MDEINTLLFLTLPFYLLYLYYNKKLQKINKYVCIFAYYEKNQQYKENLIFFLNNGGLLDNVDYYFVLNGTCTVEIPERKNIKIIKRENKGFDFGAWSNALSKINENYEYYIFINSSVRGPYSSVKSQYSSTWLDDFIKLFNTPDVKLVGSTINILEGEQFTKYYKYAPPYSHVQSMFFILNYDALIFLQNKNFFNENELNNITNMRTIILDKEVKMSQLILQNGWNINCIVPNYKNLDYRIVKKNINTNGSDVVFKNSFFGRTLLPEEVIFYKLWRFEL